MYKMVGGESHGVVPVCGNRSGAGQPGRGGWHKPGSLTQASGAWIHAAGSAMLIDPGTVELKPHAEWVWLAVEEGQARLAWQDTVLSLIHI